MNKNMELERNNMKQTKEKLLKQVDNFEETIWNNKLIDNNLKQFFINQWEQIEDKELAKKQLKLIISTMFEK